jgi:hypothetical protein
MARLRGNELIEIRLLLGGLPAELKEARPVLKRPESDPAHRATTHATTMYLPWLSRQKIGPGLMSSTH